MNDRFSGNTALRSEPDLRKEIAYSFYGENPEIPKAYTVLVRRFRLDEYESMIPCSCNVREEGSQSRKCTSCLGEGYLWDETLESTFKTDMSTGGGKAQRKANSPGGFSEGENISFYFEYNINICTNDKIVELAIDREGEPVKPLKRGKVWQIHQVDDKRSDNGRVEFYVVYCSKVSHISNGKAKRDR